jgi:glycosyltransferase involved in cell wall biosynthesis
MYAHWFTPQAITTALVSRLTGIPFVFTTHASDISVLKIVPFSKHIVKWVCMSSSSYTAVSQRTANKLIDFFSEEEWIKVHSRKLMIIPMGVKINNPSLKLLTLDKIKRKHSLNDNPIILFLGRLTEKKGVVYLLEAFSLLPKNLRDNLQLVIAGDGQLKDDLITKARSLKLNNVVFTGFVHGDEKHGLLTLADFLCLPSIIDNSGDSEGFPVVLMEGLAAGKVILSSNVSGGEVIFGVNEDRFLFAQKSAEDLKAKLILATNLTDSELRTIKKENKRLALQFSWNAIASRYYHFLKGAISNEF